MTVSEWADAYRILPDVGSAKPGPWQTSWAEYQREVMDSFNEPDVTDLVICAAVQLLKSEVILNILGYLMHLDPCPIIMVQPDERNAEDFSKDRVASMIEVTPVLRERVLKRRGGSSDKKSTKFNIGFKGGYLAIASANVEASLSSKPARVILLDEIDKYPTSAKKGGDPIDLAEKRTTTFPNAKRVKVSSPGDKDTSRILKEFAKSDQRYCYVPCVHCGLYQILKWGGKDTDFGMKWEGDDPETAYYQCEGCGGRLYEADKLEMISRPKFIPHAKSKGIRGYQISALYARNFSWEKLVAEFLKCKDDPDRLKVFVTTRLAEGWEERGSRLKEDSLFARRESYGETSPEVPDGVLVLTCAADVQDNRIEAEVKGWGLGEESWGIVHKVFYGDPSESEVWEQLEDLLYKSFKDKSGLNFQISATFIDSGHHTQMVYDFCQEQSPRAIYPIKGVGGAGIPILSAPMGKRSGKGERKIELFNIGVDEVKSRLMARLRKTQPGPGYYHFPKAYTEEFFKQLTAEECRIVDGKKTWKKIRTRNEAWDLNVYNYAALQLVDPSWKQLDERIKAARENIQEPKNQAEQRGGRRIRSRGIER